VTAALAVPQPLAFRPRRVLHRGPGPALSFKVRYVRTAAGARRYGVPIGSPIPTGRRVATRQRSGGGIEVRLTPVQRDVAERHFGGDGSERGASHTGGNRLDVPNPARAVEVLDRMLNDPESDIPPGRRRAMRALRDKIAGAAPEQGEQGEQAEPAPQPPRMTPEELVRDWQERVEMSKAERRAVYNYTGNSYIGINTYLRDGRQPGSYFSDFETEVAAMESLADRYEMPTAATVYRRVSDDAIPAGAQPGSVFTEAGFSSTSTSADAAEHASYQGRPIVMEIDVPRGSHAINVNGTGVGISAENEIILPPGSRFVVESDEMRGSERWLKMTALPPTS
jgi:hypothetical protein